MYYHLSVYTNLYNPKFAVDLHFVETEKLVNTLVKNGFKIVIYANHLLRAAHPAMEKVAKSILVNQRSFESEKQISSINKIIELIT